VRPLTVSFVIWNRPHYLRRTLDYWSKVRGIQDAVLEFHCEPGCDESVGLCESVDFAERLVLVNQERLGHAMNVQKSMDCALDRTDYAIQAVEDFLPAADLLELHAWHRDNYRDDVTVLALTSGRDVPADGGGLAPVWRSQLIGALSGFHREKWQLLSARWPEGFSNWWWWVDERWCMTDGWDVLFPALSRAEDIGEFGSTPLPEPWDVMQARSCFIPDPPPQEYYEVRGKRERGFDRHVAEY
jgi:hypothetical protein